MFVSINLLKIGDVLTTDSFSTKTEQPSFSFL